MTRATQFLLTLSSVLALAACDGPPGDTGPDDEHHHQQPTMNNGINGMGGMNGMGGGMGMSGSQGMGGGF